MKVELTGYFCPNCGEHAVYADQDDAGDYYAGTSHYCMTCHHELPDLTKTKDVLWKHAEFGGDAFTIWRYLEIRKAAGLDPVHDAETARLQAEHADAERMQNERNRR